MKRVVKLLTLAAVIAAVAVVLRRRPAPPSASPTAPPTPVAPKAEAARAQMPTMPKMPTVTTAAPAGGDADPWVEPTDDGGCPDGYPVKAKVTSKIFHVPGGVLYDKAVPDRCYASPEAAEADNYRQSLR